MKEEIKLSQDLRLKPILIPRLLQIAKVCSLNLLELREYLNHEIENNFLLEKREKRIKGVEKERDDFELKEFFQIFSEPEYYEKRRRGEEEEEEDYLSLIPSKGPSLYERLSFQIEFAFRNEEDRDIALKLIDYINSDGFIVEDLDRVAEELKVDRVKLEEIRKEIMKLDPLGVGSRDVREALLCQLEVRKMEDTLAYEIVKNHFDILSKPKEEIAAELKKNVLEVEEALILIRKLNARPGRIYSEEEPEYVMPEYVIKLRDNELVYEEVKDIIPEIRLNHTYLKMLEDENTPSEVKKFIKDYVRKAMELFELLNERRRRIEKVLNFIIEYQRDFLMSSEGKLKPISQTDASKKLNISVSALHRIITGKYVATPRGIFELKFFFPRGLRTKRGETFDRDEVKKIIKELIDKESPDSPLTDEEIRRIIKFEKGIDITRREVCKLRKEMKIESYDKRKRKKI
ncbi:MAG: RNA polymerase factor sigma-54 [candidate division WOR-3 bacterium]